MQCIAGMALSKGLILLNRGSDIKVERLATEKHYGFFTINFILSHAFQLPFATKGLATSNVFHFYAFDYLRLHTGNIISVILFLRFPLGNQHLIMTHVISHQTHVVN